MVKPRSAAAGRSMLLWATLAYLAFVIYGSLVPLEFRALPFDQALARFRAVPFLELGIGSRADWVANLLLFIPLAFFCTGALAYGRGALAGVVASLSVLVAALVLSVGIEFTQLFFPQRTVSQNDIFAETLGGMLGIALWWGAGARIMAWYQGWRAVQAPADTAQRLLLAYLVGVFAYGVLPLDLTISVVELFHKWQEGKLNLIPFATLADDPAQAAYDLATDALLWLPPALLWSWHGRRAARPGQPLSPWQAWRRTLALIVLLEVLQVFVWSRVTDLTDVFSGALGAALGAWLGQRLARAHPGAAPAGGLPRPRRAGLRWQPLALAAAWVGVLMAVFWYPYDFHTEGAFLRQQLAFLDRVPFETYYFGTEFRAVTEVFQKVLFFVPLGALLAWFVIGVPWRWRALAAFMAFLTLLLVPLGIELGQVMLPGKFPDSTDWALESLGGMAGYLLARSLGRRLFAPVPARAAAAMRRSA